MLRAEGLERGMRQVAPFLKLGARRLSGRKSPFSMAFSLTNRCNFNCCYCDLPEQVREELPTGEWIRAIDELRAGGMGRASLIGGEPLLRDDLGAIISHLEQAGIHTAINTNGWFVAERISELEELDLVCVTLDGGRELHDRQRHEGSYDRVLDGVHLLRRAGAKVVTMTVVTGPERDSIRHVLDFARSAGILAFFQIEHDATADVLAPVAPQLSDGDIADIARYLLDLKGRGFPVGKSRLLLERLIRDGRRLGQGCSACFAGRYYGYVLCDGTVAPCLLTQRQVEQGNGRSHGYLEAFTAMAPPQGAGCGCMPTHEINAVLSFNLRVLLNAVELALGSRNSGIRRR